MYTVNNQHSVVPFMGSNDQLLLEQQDYVGAIHKLTPKKDSISCIWPPRMTERVKIGGYPHFWPGILCIISRPRLILIKWMEIGER